MLTALSPFAYDVLQKEEKMNSYLEIFISVFFLFGLYSAAIEIYKFAIGIYRVYKRRRTIDKKRKKR